MKVGHRVIKTVIAIAISIFIARLCRLSPDHFAGIISMLAVQPSVYRSLHHTLSHLASALLASIVGLAAVLTLGDSSLVIAGVCLLVMAAHIRLRQTASLTLAVIVAINTMGTSEELLGSAAAYNQIMLVLIGMLVGTIVNMVSKPQHQEREEVLLNQSESMLRSLMYFVQLDIQARRMTPYKNEMRNQIEEVRGYIEKGKSISQLIREDRWLSRARKSGAGESFTVYETMIERIRDLVKALQKADLNHPEAIRLHKAIDLVVRVQERRVVHNRAIPIRLLLPALKPSLKGVNGDEAQLLLLFPYYQAYEALIDYIRALDSSQRHVTAAQLTHFVKVA